MSLVLRSTVDTSLLKELPKDLTLFIGYPEGISHTSVDGKTGETRVWDSAELAEKLSVGFVEADGTNVPARPHLYEGLEANEEELRETVQAYFTKTVDGSAPDVGMVGQVAVEAIRDYVKSPGFKETYPNAPYTIEKKGSDQPLIDTEALINTITYIVKGEK